ncbi:MAG: PPC domain-containing protein [Anaerolineae bacterium]|nr:PPC domain-containing protein [Anaerolineae bacterium]
MCSLRGRAWLWSAALLLFVMMALPLHAQEATPDAPEQPNLSYGLGATGAIDDNAPRVLYSFDGLRGEFISLTLRATSGDLDPVLLVMDEAGAVLARRDDSSGTRDIHIESIRIPQTDRYYVVVGRFGYALGTTRGEFELELERIGASFSDGSGLRYGDTVLNQITDMNPRVYYTFRAQRGDIITLRLERTSGDLDPALQLVDSQGTVVAENDEIEGSGSLDAAIVGHIIEKDDTYIIIATRYGQVAGRSSGSFILTLDSGATGGLGRTAESPIPLISDQPYDGEITDARFEQYYRFEGKQFDIVTIEMNRDGGALDSLLVLTDDQQNPLASDDDSGGGQNAAIRQFALPYDGTYYVIATRFQREQGTTAGKYLLSLRTEGNAFDGVPGDIGRMVYGSTANGTLDDLVPRILVTFYGAEGDVITISMTRTGGDLDSVVTLLDANQQVLISDDDSGGSQNALIERYTLPASGIYFIQASRFEGADRPVTRGSFIMVLARRFD